MSELDEYKLILESIQVIANSHELTYEKRVELISYLTFLLLGDYT
jgi:hypothetical protein